MKTKSMKIFEELRDAIELVAKEAPFELDGYTWAECQSEFWAEQLGVSLRTFGRMINAPPIVKDCITIGGKKTLLLRIGEPGPQTDRHKANVMSKVFREQTGIKPPPDAYGCLFGLAQVWPDGAEIDIFRMVLDHWSTYMAGVKLEISLMQEEGQAVQVRYLKYPSIKVMRRFPNVALEMYVDRMQELGKLPPPSVVNLNPELWKAMSGI